MELVEFENVCNMIRKTFFDSALKILNMEYLFSHADNLKY